MSVQVGSTPGLQSNENETSPLLGSSASDTTASLKLSDRSPSPFWIYAPVALTALVDCSVILLEFRLARDISWVYQDAQPGEIDLARQNMLIMGMGLLSGLPRLISVPSLSIISDTSGRKKPMVATACGVLGSHILMLCAAMTLDQSSAGLLLAGSALKGFSGSTFTLTTISTAYVSDCAAPKTRTTAISWLYGWLALAYHIGVTVSNTLTERSWRIETILGIAVGLDVLVLIFLLFLVPESLFKLREWDNDDQSAPETSSRRRRLPFCWLDLSNIWTNPIARRNAMCLIAIACLVLASGPNYEAMILFFRSLLGRSPIPIQSMITTSGVSYAVTAIVLLPLLDYILQKRTSTTPDLVSLRITLIALGIGNAAFGASTSHTALLSSSALLGLGCSAVPIAQSSLTKLASARRTGALLGVTGLAHLLVTMFWNERFFYLVSKPAWLVITIFIAMPVLALILSVLIRIEAQPNEQTTEI